MKQRTTLQNAALHKLFELWATALNDAGYSVNRTLENKIVELVNEQAEDDGLWFVAKTVPEAYLQKALRKLHESIERTSSIEVPWNKTLIKELMWRPVMQAMTEKFSTTELDRVEIDQIYEVLNKHFGGKLGIHVPFPCDSTDERTAP